MSILALDGCLGVCCSVLGCSLRQSLFPAQIFCFLLIAEAAAGRGIAVRSPIAIGKGFGRVGTQALWIGFFESQPGPVLLAIRTAPLVQLSPLCQTHGMLRAVCELMAGAGGAGASRVQSAELQETWGGKGNEWLLGVWLLAPSCLQQAGRAHQSGSVGVVFKVAVVVQYLNHYLFSICPVKRVCNGGNQNVCAEGENPEKGSSL